MSSFSKRSLYVDIQFMDFLRVCSEIEDVSKHLHIL